jgi:hypothetical protein
MLSAVPEGHKTVRTQTNLSDSEPPHSSDFTKFLQDRSTSSLLHEINHQSCLPSSPCKSSTRCSLLFAVRPRKIAAAPAPMSRTPSFPRSTSSQLKTLRCDHFCAPSAANLLCDTGVHRRLPAHQLSAGVLRILMRCLILVLLWIHDEGGYRV